MPGLRQLVGVTADDVELTRVTGHGWRLTDARLPFGHPFRLLAFIEARPEGFEVLQLGSGR